MPTYGPPGECFEACIDDIFQKDIFGVLQPYAPSLEQGKSTLHGSFTELMTEFNAQRGAQKRIGHTSAALVPRS